jgi:hypothetical protein
MKNIIAFIIFIIPLMTQAQSPNLFIPVNMVKAYKTGSRNINGAPGENYWQNKPVYLMNLDFDPQTTILSGMEEITYTNNSPDTLKQIVFTMLGDIYKTDNYNHDWNLPRSLTHEGIMLKKIVVEGTDMELDSKNIRRSGTNMFIALEKPLAPKSSINFEIVWKYKFPRNAVIRAGNYGDSTFMIAYYYPKIAVYDDIDGWDKHNYTGFGEFYSEVADYDVNITVPGDFKVWATGELQNPGKVLSPEYLKRWQDAHVPGNMVRIIDKNEVEKREVTLPGDKLTWNYKAEHVADFSFGTSNIFRWDAKSIVVDKKTGRQTFLCTAYAKDRKYYPRIINLLDTVLSNYSTRIPGVPYQYPSMKIFNGNAGMEFAMMCNDAEGGKWVNNVGLTYHEVGHSYFPFTVITNERKYAWMDEGWATFFPNFYIKDHLDKNDPYNYMQTRIKTYYQIAGKDIEVPEMVLVDLLRLRAPYRQASYNKSFLAYYYLYDYLGEDKFLKAFRGYIKRWIGKHPIPFDFFYSINDLSGENLDWFWQNWFFDFGYGDLGLELKNKNTLTIKNIGHLALPVRLKITYKDGHNSNMSYNLKIWKNANNIFNIPLKTPENIKKIELGADWIIDVDKSNNVLEF